MKKRILKTTLLMMVLSFTMISCKGKTESSVADSEHNALTSLDWAGSYSGILPCADCEGIETELTLTADGEFTLSTNYLGVDEPATFTESGTFKWAKDGNSIELEGLAEGSQSPYYKVEENRIQHLDIEGNLVEGDLAPFYTLTKMGNSAVENQKWKIVELFGEKVKDDADNFYLVFHSEENRLEAKANCNVLLLEYKIKNELQLEVLPGITTLMACPDEWEAKLIQALDAVDNISVGEGTLTLNKARMAPMVVLELAK